MKGLFFIMFSTFALGIFSGMYVYLQTQDSVPATSVAGTIATTTSAAGTAPARTQTISTPSANNSLTRGFEVTADQFGVCAKTTGCVSYHVATDGTFTQVLYDVQGGQSKHTGKLSDGELDKLVAELRKTSLGDIPKRATACNLSQVTALRYIVRIGDTTYRFDTCAEAFAGSLASGLVAFDERQ